MMLKDEVRPTTELVQSLIDTHATLDAKMAVSKVSLFSGSAVLDPTAENKQSRWDLAQHVCLYKQFLKLIKSNIRSCNNWKWPAWAGAVSSHAAATFYNNVRHMNGFCVIDRSDYWFWLQTIHVQDS